MKYPLWMEIAKENDKLKCYWCQFWASVYQWLGEHRFPSWIFNIAYIFILNCEEKECFVLERERRNLNED